MNGIFRFGVSFWVAAFAVTTFAGFVEVPAMPPTDGKDGALGECRLKEFRFTDLPANAVRFGSDGLMPISAPLPSCGTLAIVEPMTRKGIVFGWISNVNGSGAFAVRRDADGSVAVTPILDYGPMPKGTKVAAPDVFVWGRFDDCRLGLEQYAERAAEYNGVRLPPNRSGYCTWCSDRHGYSDRSTYARGEGPGSETSTIECAELAAKLLKPYGFDFIQLDDQWQNGEEYEGCPARDFTRTHPKGPYPRGFGRMVDALGKRGITAGLWFIPFGAVRKEPAWAGCDDLYARSKVTIPTNRAGNIMKRPAAKARKAGDPHETFWCGASLDMTNPRARERVADTVRRMTKEWGFRYLKCDGISSGFASDLYGGYGWQDVGFANVAFSDRKASNIAAYRMGLRTIREAAAPGTFLLGCNLGCVRAAVPSFGFFDAMRVGIDNGPIDMFPDRYMHGVVAGSMRYFYNGRVWWNDPDSTYVRAATPLTRARSMASWTALTDSLFEVGDWIGDLPEERLEILRRTLAHHGVRNVRPIDLFENRIPNGWILDGGRHKVVGLFNWKTNETLKVDWSFAYAGLEEGRTYVGHEFWSGENIQPFEGRLKATVPPDDCRIIALAEVGKGTEIVSTSLHVASPVYGVKDGKLLTVAGEPLTIWTYNRKTGFAKTIRKEMRK